MCIRDRNYIAVAIDSQQSSPSQAQAKRMRELDEKKLLNGDVICLLYTSPRDFGYPVCSIEKEYINSASGQLRTRFQAFVESIEIKKIQEGK